MGDIKQKHLIQLNEFHVPGYGNFYHATNILANRKSKYCQITVFDTEEIGRVLLIDGDNMFATGTEHVYHESMAHVPLFLHDDPKSLLIIGGGDGGVLKEVVKHESLQEITLVDIDEEVVRTCREFFPEMTAAMDDERVTVKIDDGVEHVRKMRKSGKKVDVCIVDSNDLYLKEVDPSNVLGTAEFYADLYEIISDDGLVMQILGSHVFWRESLRMVYENIFKVWQHVYPYITAVPLYASGYWSLVLMSKREIDPLSPRKCNISGLKQYNTAIHRAGFALPNDLLELVSAEAKKAGRRFYLTD